MVWRQLIIRKKAGVVFLRVHKAGKLDAFMLESATENLSFHLNRVPMILVSKVRRKDSEWSHEETKN